MVRSRSPVYDPQNPVVVLKVKQVLGLLYESSKPWTAEEIDARVDLQGVDKAIFFKKLSTYPRVLFDGQRYSYRSGGYVRDAMRLRVLTRQFAEVDLKDDATFTEEEGTRGTSKRKFKRIKLTTPSFNDLFKYTPEGIREEEEEKRGGYVICSRS
ncbi:hypothetical protein HanXRQr2_Chr12g0531221 [Helianthus annuus]|nr:uncharacterized protein LOC110894341 [Helianthus annuus]KAF5777060.1 hypothetical protein HanXRQr2_Chr12g0531221 [Helianthus annuus]KAJ0492216.1 hypothetical protein HanIR_Chr12g0572351 [Helianthus annuus]KAJ0504505.1 hypothetical protein HanHA89_Chr12g0460021 [Helianthus annuus]KAJ0674226.1 hypothetical protein HanLR1_Chr12g0437591 [Helianthus annuus]KAJ0861889.1 hypothetical protein HanPSC8_Chr12g0511791 [Helianthus annuus]